MKTYAQIQQDIWVLQNLNYKKDGFFVEFGASDGKTFSNSLLLEEDYAWNGIVCEPLIRHHKTLFNNRNCHINTQCVYPETGKILSFFDSGDKDLGLLSCIQEFKADQTSYEKNFNVLSISLNDLLALYNAPSKIDYMSVDTEGGEYEILKSLNWDKYDVSLITVEHNWGAERQPIFELLTSKGYQRFNTDVSRWDDWYFKPNLN